MAGIAGMLITSNHKRKAFNARNLIVDMISEIKHSDSEPSYIREVLPNHCWLAYSQPYTNKNSKAYKQPYSSQSGNTELVFNGQIYNLNELDTYLVHNNYTPKTESDTERLTELIDIIGVEALNAIDGMFAFAALNKNEKSLFLARDRYGQKNIYYVEGNGIFAFASEISPLLLLSNWIHMEVSLTALGQYMSIGYINAPLTAVSPIRKLEAGKLMLVEMNGLRLEDRFFSLSRKGTLITEEKFTDIKEIRSKPYKIFSKLLNESITRTQSGSAGIIMNGDVGSTLLAATINQEDKKSDLSDNIRFAYTLILKGKQENSIQLNSQLCKQWGWKHRILYIDEKNLIDSYLSISRSLDEPIGHISILSNWIQMESVNQFHDVAIGGIGAEEFFMGHKRYIQTIKNLELYKTPKSWNEFYWGNGLATGDQNSFKVANSHLSIEPMKNLFKKSEILRDLCENQPLIFMQWLDIITYLPGAILANISRVSMNLGLQVRSPLLDTRLTIFALTLNPENHIYNQEGEIMLKNQLSSIIGKDIPTQTFKCSKTHHFKNSVFVEFLKNKVLKNLNEIKSWDKDSHRMWIETYIKYAHNWNQESLFRFSLYLDWLKNISKRFPQIN